jgi:simple sugar transport system substrate-binding protein
MRNRPYALAALTAVGLVASAWGSGPRAGATGQATGGVAGVAAAGTTTGGATASSAPVVTVSSAPGTNLTFYVITHGIIGPFWSVVQRGAEQAGKDLGVTVIYESSNSDAGLQSQLIEAAIAKRPAGIAISLADPATVSGAAKAVVAAKIPLYTINSGINDYKALGAVTHIGQDEVVAGEGAGDRFTQLGAKSVLCARAEQPNIGLIERCNGLAHTFKGTVRTAFVGVETDPAAQEAQIAALLQANPDIDAILGTGPNVARSAIGAAQTVGRNAIIGGFDITPDLIAAVKAGKLAFTVDQQQYLQGYLPVVLMYLQATNLNTAGGGLPILTGPSFVDKDNVDQISPLVDKGTR